MRDGPTVSLGLPRPGKGLLWVMGVLVFIWVMFAVALNFGGLTMRSFLLFAGNTDAIAHGEVWRLFTAGLIHLPRGSGSVEHIFYTLLGLYFLAPSLEERWGARRFVQFLVASSVFGFTAQFLAELLLPHRLGSVLSQEYWFGSFGTVEAVAIAWALSNPGKSLRLYFMIPISTTVFVLFIIGFSLFRIIGADLPLEGAVTPFGGMLAGYFFGAGTPSPFRRLLLKGRFFWLARRAQRFRASRPKLTVIEGKRGRRADSDPPPSGRRPPTDKRFLN